MAVSRVLLNTKTWVSHAQLKLDKRIEPVRARLVFPERFKGTIVERWADYWKALCLDYYEVTKDVVQTAVAKPVKASVMLALGAAGAYCAKHNPSETDFQDHLVSRRNELIFIGRTIRNPRAVTYLTDMQTNFNHGLVRYFSLGLCSVIWLDDHHPTTSGFDAQCGYLKPKLYEYYSRIVDFGFLDRWWLMDKTLEDMDVNPEEWTSVSHQAQPL